MSTCILKMMSCNYTQKDAHEVLRQCSDPMTKAIPVLRSSPTEGGDSEISFSGTQGFLYNNVITDDRPSEIQCINLTLKRHRQRNLFCSRSLMPIHLIRLRPLLTATVFSPVISMSTLSILTSSLPMDFHESVW